MIKPITLLGKRNYKQAGNLICDSDLELQLFETPTKRKAQTPVITKVSLREACDELSPAFARALEFGGLRGNTFHLTRSFVEPVSPPPLLLLRSKSLYLKQRPRLSEGVNFHDAQSDGRL